MGSRRRQFDCNGAGFSARRPSGIKPPILQLSDAYLRVDSSTQREAESSIKRSNSTARRIVTPRRRSQHRTPESDAATVTANPVRDAPLCGQGQAAAFAYDLATSVVYTRQGNPAWATQERDGFAPIRPDDKFYGNAAGDPRADWIDLNKVAIPQADEQQRCSRI
jgi:hypothetical protein